MRGLGGLCKELLYVLTVVVVTPPSAYPVLELQGCPRRNGDSDYASYTSENRTGARNRTGSISNGEVDLCVRRDGIRLCFLEKNRPLLVCPETAVCSRIQELSEYVQQDVEDRKAMDFICLGFIIPESEKRIQKCVEILAKYAQF